MKCMSCGTEMNSTTGGNYTCPKCGQSINDGVYRPSTSNTYGQPYLGWGQMGWICPRCGKVLAPDVKECTCKPEPKSNINDSFYQIIEPSGFCKIEHKHTWCPQNSSYKCYQYCSNWVTCIPV